MRLLRRLRSLSPDSTIVVHHDPRGGALDKSAVRQVGGDIRVIHAEQPVRWGDMSMIDALLRCLRWVEENVSYTWLVHLSGQDYPIRPLTELEAKLAGEGMDAYIVANRLGTQRDADRSKEAVRRYFYRYYQLPGPLRLRRVAAGRTGEHGANNRSRAGWRRLVNVKVLPRGEGVRIGLPARRTPFTDEFPCWKGSFWVLLSRRAVRYYLDTVEQRPELLDYYKRTTNPDESVTTTIVANAPGLRVCDNPLRFTSWSGGPHPELIRMEHLPAAFASGAFFARKFTEADPAVYAAVDAHLDVVRQDLGAG
jgi:hypothetical protein